MAGPYDYTVNIPQPPAQNFLQSLMGIRQLQQMEEQSAISQQQAAIQQQNAAFQQQLQPLEKQRLEATIAAQRANTAQSMASRDVAMEGLRQSKVTFGREEELNKQADALRADMMKLSTDPTSATREKLLDLSYRAAAFAPKSYEPLQKMLKDYPRTGKVLENTASDVIFSVQSGQPTVAAGSVEKALKGAENTLKENPNDKDAQAALALLQPVQSLMQQEKYGEAMIIASNFLRNTYPERWDAVTKDMKDVAGITETQAKAKETTAKAETETWQGALTKWKAQNAMKGELDPDEVVKRENSLRENFLAQPAVRGYQDKIESYDNVKTAKPTTPGDVAKMTAFIKLGDPRSTVSMGESGQLVASNIGEKTAKLVEQFNLNGGKLTDDMRKKIDLQADATMRAAKKSFENGILRGFNETAKRQKINPENVTGFLPPVYIAEENQGPTSEEERIRAMLRPAAGFGNTMTPSQIQPQGGTFQGTPSDVDAILKQFGVR